MLCNYYFLFIIKCYFKDIVYVLLCIVVIVSAIAGASKVTYSMFIKLLFCKPRFYGAIAKVFVL